MKFKPIQITPREMDFQKVRDFCRDEIAKVFIPGSRDSHSSRDPRKEIRAMTKDVKDVANNRAIGIPSGGKSQARETDREISRPVNCGVCGEPFGQVDRLRKHLSKCKGVTK